MVRTSHNGLDLSEKKQPRAGCKVGRAFLRILRASVRIVIVNAVLQAAAQEPVKALCGSGFHRVYP